MKKAQKLDCSGWAASQWRRAADGLRIRHKQQFLCRCFRIGIGG